ncbi:MAG: beta-galactosidase trimerization domain-containing protein [Bacteroidales bacterium]|nr:beta-galactosidase trimerization domain-containing protein [Bacteroidales bacterium]MCF8326724.1 beta-galactosidase trimerization domain-containing protein [Bacteroidales bacterium]
MKKHKTILLFLLILLFSSCGQQVEEQAQDKKLDNQLPKVLIITTGLEGQNATLPKGIVIALQAFNQAGAIVRLETRDILYEPEKLMNYNMMILSTAPGYHDADRKYSLSYMSEKEMERIKHFVDKGGVLISGDNVGRNLLEGTDRITLHNKLSGEHYPLAECFGVQLAEKNMEGFRIFGRLKDEGEKSYMRPEAENYFYTLVPDSIVSEQAEILASWVNSQDTIPAVTRNRYGQGTAYLLASSDLLHPANEGGFLSAERITGFYKSVVRDFYQQNDIPLQLNPWPEGHDYAFCVTMNAEGEKAEYERMFQLLKKHDIKPQLFVHGNVHEAVKSVIEKNEVQLQSRGYDFDNYRQLNYAQSVHDILRNEQSWQQSFQGFRFPYTMPGFWGLMALTEKEYMFESSIGANNLEFLHGSVVPHNIVFSGQGFYKSTDIIEMAPTYQDDYSFFKELNQEMTRPALVKKKTRLYKKYLQNYWNYAVKPYKGVMVYQGHPGYVGQNDTTITALEELIETVKTDNTWTATISEIADFRKNLTKLRFYVTRKNMKIVVSVNGPKDVKVPGVSFRTDFQPENVKAANGKANIQSDSTGYFVMFDAMDGQKLTININ